MWGPALSSYMSLSTPSWTLHEESIQLHVAGSVAGQQPTFSRKLASKQLGLRVSLDKQMVTVCTQGECYQAVIISKAAICPPNRSFPSLNTHPIKSYISFHFQLDLWGAHAMIILCKCHSIFSLLLHLFTSVLLDLTASFLLWSDSGADDLLPILSFVALRCQCPQLVSECAALEEFIHEG